MRLRRNILGLLAVAAGGCGSPTTPDGFPELADAYIGTLEAEFTSVPGGVRTSGVPCALTLEVASQGGATFEGSYHRGVPCVPRAYPIAGTVQKDGDGLQMRIDVVLACAPSGTQRTVATFEARASRR